MKRTVTICTGARCCNPVTPCEQCDADATHHLQFESFQHDFCQQCFRDADETTREVLMDLLGLNMLTHEPSVQRATAGQLANTNAGLAEIRNVVFHHWRSSHPQSVQKEVLDELVTMRPRELRATAQDLLLGNN